MFAVQCSFCQHENVPGARFCAECGSPLHLRVCPNPDCGKVSDVNATRCEHCGTVLPKIALAEPGSSTGDATPAAAPAQDSQPAKKSTIAAWPLIIVAIVAGGLPLLWFNRAYLPAPKPWQGEVAKPPTAPLTPPLPPPLAPPVESKPVSAPLAAAPEPVPSAESAKPVAEEPPKQEEAKAKSARETKKIRQATATQEQPPRPCTEAVAAVGLCDPKQARK
jgi:hypothetical protein